MCGEVNCALRPYLLGRSEHSRCFKRSLRPTHLVYKHD
eukprot:UN06603